jgi:beta-glucosidase
MVPQQCKPFHVDFDHLRSRADTGVPDVYREGPVPVLPDDHSKIDRPVHELKAFSRVELQPGETKAVQFSLQNPAFSYWSPEKKDWAMDPGTFEVQVGSSRDIPLKKSVALN